MALSIFGFSIRTSRAFRNDAASLTLPTAFSIFLAICFLTFSFCLASFALACSRSSRSAAPFGTWHRGIPLSPPRDRLGRQLLRKRLGDSPQHQVAQHFAALGRFGAAHVDRLKSHLPILPTFASLSIASENAHDLPAQNVRGDAMLSGTSTPQP